MRDITDKLYDAKDIGELLESAIDEINELRRENEKLQNELDEAQDAINNHG